MEKITVADLLLEIDKAAVEKQSDLLNKVRLMEAKQERDEPVTIFVPRLCGLANICVLSTPCTGRACEQSVSYVEPSILLALVKGQYDGDTKGEVLSKVTQINLEDTVAFVEAREIGKQDVQILGGGPSSGQVNAVLVQGNCCDVVRKATMAGHQPMSGRIPAKHSTQPVRNVA